MKNIVLIGMMGCGKTCNANLLHGRLGRPVVVRLPHRGGRGAFCRRYFCGRGVLFRDLETAVAKGCQA